LQNNTQSMNILTSGAACLAPGNHLLGPCTLGTKSFPVCGNRDFGYTVANTSGTFGEFVLLVFSTGPASASQPPLLPPTAGPACPEYLDYSLLLGVMLVGATPGGTTLPHSFANVPVTPFRGMRVLMQAMVLDSFTPVPPY